MGQNMVGWCRLKLRVPGGHARSRCATPRCSTTTARSTRPTCAVLRRSTSTSARGGEAVFEPHFTYHGFRYVEVTGLPEPAEGRRPDRPRVPFRRADVGQFACSNELDQQDDAQCRQWVQRGNMHSVPTDCPQRDERLGWMGDIQAFSQTAIFNMDMAGFFTQMGARHPRLAGRRRPLSRLRPAPRPIRNTRRASGVPAWADAGTVVPWRMYQNYADRRMLEEHFESARRWVDYRPRTQPEPALAEEPRQRLQRLAQRRHADAGRLSHAASAPCRTRSSPRPSSPIRPRSWPRWPACLGRKDDAAKYGKLFEDIKAAFNRAYVAADGRIKGDTQAGYALALHFNLLDRTLSVRRRREHLLEAIRKYKDHPSTGIQTTHRMMLELTRNGHHDEACRLINLRTVPSWGYMIDMGATTIWERWDGYVEGTRIPGPGHELVQPLGVRLGGRMDVARHGGHQSRTRSAGLQAVYRSSAAGTGFTWVKGQYDSIRGRIISDWRIDSDRFTLKLQVPPGAMATVYLPSNNASATTENGQPASGATGVHSMGTDGHEAVYRVESGCYEFTTPFTAI